MTATASTDEAPAPDGLSVSVGGVIAGLGAAVLLIIVLMVIAAHQVPATSRYPVLRNAEAFGKLTSYTARDVIFYFACVHAPSSLTPLAPGFYQVPTSQMKFRVELPSGPRGQTALRTVPETLFLRTAVGHNWAGSVYVFAHRREITNAPSSYRCPLPRRSS